MSNAVEAIEDLVKALEAGSYTQKIEYDSIDQTFDALEFEAEMGALEKRAVAVGPGLPQRPPRVGRGTLKTSVRRVNPFMPTKDVDDLLEVDEDDDE